MTDITFEVDTSIYKNRSILKDSYTPDEIVGRTEELTAYRNALTPVVNGEDPDNIFLYGKSGVGKTASTNYILDILTDKCDSVGIDLTVLKINCDTCNTSYQVAIKLVNKLRAPDNQLSQSGHAEWKVFEELFEELDSIGGTVLLVFDEIDSLDNDKLDKLLYQLPRAKSNNNLENTNIGIIGISSDLTLLDKLAPDVKSTLCDKSIEFSPYNSQELTAVLEQRADITFYDDALTAPVIPLCATLGSQDGGDARKALDLLREAGDIARQSDDSQITKNHVQQARTLLAEERILSAIENLSLHEKITMYALLTLTEEGNPTPRSREIFDRYETLTKHTGYEPVTYRSVRDYLSSFNSLNLTLSEAKHTGPDGNYRIHELNYPSKAVAQAIEDTISKVGVHTAITDLDIEATKTTTTTT